MISHEPREYTCPFCNVVAGRETEYNAQADVVFRNEETTALVSPKWWDAAPGHVIVIPNAHVENVYAITDELLAAVYRTAKRIAVALKEAEGYEGTSMRQHNEPGAGQDVWHFHVHVFPRSAGDRLYERNAEERWVSPAERALVAERLRAVLA
ncbi:MAG TPA: HIT family protein [Gaiellaceae bacterium]